jgi:hypothetical protein
MQRTRACIRAHVTHAHMYARTHMTRAREKAWHPWHRACFWLDFESATLARHPGTYWHPGTHKRLIRLRNLRLHGAYAVVKGL